MRRIGSADSPASAAASAAAPSRRLVVAGRYCVPSRTTQEQGHNRMFDTALVFLAITAAVAVGGLLGLLSMVIMAIELWSED
jgi:hypothetical protein